ncbi:MAG: ornithine carbamoyltransferase [Nitrospirota bacterium]
MTKDLLTLASFPDEDFFKVLERAALLKALKLKGEERSTLKGRTLAMIFEKSSTRTRVSFEAGITQLGGHAIFLSSADTQIGRGEEVRDTARVLSRYVDAIMVRTYRQESVEVMAKFATVPVINGLTDMHHPCQVLADLLTIKEKLGSLKGMKLAYIGDGNNMANSLIEGSAKAGMDIALACPEGYDPDSGILAWAKEKGMAGGTSVQLVRDPIAAASGADVLYTDVWASMGQESEKASREKHFRGFQINAELLSIAKPGAIVLHCLPAHRGEEITDEAMEGKNSAVFDQAENRLHVQKALLELLITG